MAPGCKPGGLTPYVGSNPTPCTTVIVDCRLSIANWFLRELVFFNWQLKISNRQWFHGRV
jgi:hypothetical protein